MTDVVWSSFAPWVRHQVPGCPDPLIERAVCDAAIEFCTMTQAFTERLALTTVVGTASYPLTPTAGVISMILGVTLADRTLSPVFMDALTNALGDSWQDDEGTPVHFLADDESTLRVYPNPDEVETGTVLVALKPDRSATCWSSRLYQHYPEIVTQGALARLYGQSGVAWSNPNEALTQRRYFMQGINKARAKVQTAYVPSTLYTDF